MFMIRWLLGRLILSIDFITSPSSAQRTAQAQAQLDAQTLGLSLYQLPACPFCVKVRREIKRLGLTISLVNINQHNDLRQELIREGGKRTVPCLRITPDGGDTHWLYESDDIIRYLQKVAS